MLALFLRLIFAAWGVHFWDLASQAVLFGGKHGLSPLDATLGAVAAREGPSMLRRFNRRKTIFWVYRRDWFLWFLPGVVGTSCCLVGMIGYCSREMFLLCLVIYHSMDALFQDGLNFPWENLLFESGFTALFSPRLVAWELFALERSRYGWVAVSGLRWLLFRLMIGFGKTKFIDGEATRDNSLYIRTFLFVQPLPNKLARFVAELPASWSLLWKGSLFFMWLVEVPLPFLMLLPWTREIAAYGTNAAGWHLCDRMLWAL